MKYNFTLLLSIFLSSLIYSQTEYLEKYDNGEIKIKGSLIDSVLLGKYTEYYKNGQVKTTGEFKNCEYKTNRVEVFVGRCGADFYTKLAQGRKHGVWTEYYENGVLKSKSNYFCGLSQGNFFYYHENGKLFFIDFYTENKLLGTQEFYENGFLKIISTYTYEYDEQEENYLKKTVETEYYNNGSLKIQRIIQELKGDIEKETLKEYYLNGFLKIESETLDLDKNGIYRECYENGNTKYVGIFKDDEPIGKQYYYNESGEITKIETWEKGKIIKIENNKATQN